MRRLAGFLALLFAGSAWALDFRSIAEASILYDAPSQKARPMFAIAAGTPVEAIVTLDSWVKVRDIKGDLAWIERSRLSDKRMLQVRGGSAQVRGAAEETAPVVFEAETDVVLELVENASAGWVKVRHRDGQQGFVKLGQVWGL